jgi:hypothetical protein
MHAKTRSPFSPAEAGLFLQSSGKVEVTEVVRYVVLIIFRLT